MLVMNQIMLGLGYSKNDIMFYTYVDPRGTTYSAPRLELQTNDETLVFLKDVVRFRIMEVYCQVMDLPEMIVAVKQTKNKIWMRALKAQVLPTAVEIKEFSEEGEAIESACKHGENMSTRVENRVSTGLGRGNSGSFLALAYEPMNNDGGKQVEHGNHESVEQLHSRSGPGEGENSDGGDHLHIGNSNEARNLETKNTENSEHIQNSNFKFVDEQIQTEFPANDYYHGYVDEQRGNAMGEENMLDINADDHEMDELISQILQADIPNSEDIGIIGQPRAQEEAEMRANVNEEEQNDGCPRFNISAADGQNDDMEDVEDEVLGDDDLDDGLLGPNLSEYDITGDDNETGVDDIIFGGDGLGNGTANDADMHIGELEKRVTKLV